MRKCVLALFVASSFAVVTAAQDQAPGAGAPKPQQPAAQGEQPRPAAPPAAQGEQPRPAAPAAAQAQSKVTISGCIQNAPTAAATPGGAAPAPAAKWVLANAKAAAGAGAVGTAGSAATATRYQLDGEEKAISPHVNHQVEITGTVQPPGAAAAAGGATAGPMLKVDSVKMVADKCS